MSITPDNTRDTPQAGAVRRQRFWGPIQFGTALGLSVALFDRALRDDILPPPDAGTRSRPNRWSQAVVDDAVGRAEEIRAAVGSIPDLGAQRAAEILAERFGCEVTAETVEELARTGALPEVSQYKGYPLYCGRTLERFDDPAAMERAERDGRLYTLDAAADQLDVRVSDLRHLVTAGWLEPVKHVHSRWQRRNEVRLVALFRAADLAVLAEHPAIDWEAVRATPAGHRSPLIQVARFARAPRGTGRR
ncbi:hypothetical protein [Nocardia sp. CC227C]|uniref:hypothetical protein n=1 Tax=Nocardia sp. CC227C TaxID=3044562 RepID=UPI00278C6244|nr:hypothetical protein [Nocardia sp. CC227C]